LPARISGAHGDKARQLALSHGETTKNLCRGNAEMGEWKIIALVKALDVVAIETFVTDLHPGA
jgi:hypothetical protein